ncbi:MAG: FtsQ-type POTRA domain-containing protein [Acidimicrobiales bacterium]|nr:FtsQ-type POTRA domain-containing protein [Acidimicrobiales bacterium]
MNSEEVEADSELPKKKSLRKTWVVLVLLVLGVGAYATTKSSFFSVKEVEVVGTGDRVSEDEVLEASGINDGSSMVGLNVEEIDERVTAIPWVAQVDIERNWPDSVRIVLEERIASLIAVIPSGQKFLLDRSGVVLEEVSVDGLELPIIRVDSVGVLGTGIMGITPLLRAAEEVTPDLQAWILALAATGGGVRAELVGGVVAELGIGGTDFRDEMRSLATVLTRVQLSCIELIDVSIPQNPVVSRTQGRC